MKWNMFKRFAAAGLTAVLSASLLIGCGDKKAETNAEGDEIAELTWWQIGDAQKDQDRVLEKVNEYIGDKIGVKLKINTAGWGDYDQKMQVVINTGDDWDLCFTCSWANNYLQNANKGAFLQIDDYIKDTEMYQNIDKRFWEAAKVQGKTYGVPSEKEIGSMPMWVFTKEYVDKYDVPVEDIHSLEDLEPWLKVIKENEPDVVPMYLTSSYSAPIYMDLNP